MKTVFSSSFEIAHLFANKIQTGRSSNTHCTVSILGTWAFYSYNTVIATHIENKKGETAVLINDYNYSVTTSKHQREVISACSHLKQFYTSRTEIERVYDRISELIENLVPKAKARKQDYLNEAKALLESYETFHKWNLNNSTKAANWNKHTLYVKAKKLVAIADDQEKLIKYTAAENRALNKARKAEEKRVQEERARELADWYKDVAEWVSGERGRTPYKPFNALEDYIRVSPDGQYIQTTQRVSIPIQSARILYKMILAGKDIKGYDLEGYTVIGLNGVLTIGCHKINVENMHAVGKQIIAE
jgi:anthranilate/para-aminobenzoate synthase component I